MRKTDGIIISHPRIKLLAALTGITWDISGWLSLRLAFLVANTLSEEMGTVGSEDAVNNHNGEVMIIEQRPVYISEGFWGGKAFGGQCIFYFEKRQSSPIFCHVGIN